MVPATKYISHPRGLQHSIDIVSMTAVINFTFSMQDVGLAFALCERFLAWLSLHPCTDDFFSYQQNKQIADVIGCAG